MIRQPQHRPLSAPAIARRIVTRRAALGMAAGGALALGTPSAAQTALASVNPGRKGGTLRIGMRVLPMRDPRLFDWTEMGNIARQVIEPLVRFTTDGRLVPWLLEGWQAAPDARRVTLYLRREVRWSNGDAFTAADVAYNLARWCDTTVPGNSMAVRCAALIDAKTGQLAEGAVEIHEPHRLTLHLKRRDATLMAGLADYPALMVHRDFDEAGADIVATPIGTGPFTLTDFAPGLRARVERREGWWGGEVPLDAVQWTDLGVGPTAEMAAFTAGAIDLNTETPVASVTRFDALGLRRYGRLTGNTIVARMRIDRPPYHDPAVRRAIAMAVDNDVVLALGHGGMGLRAENTHAGPMHPDAADIRAPRADPAAARRQLAALRLQDYPFELVSIDDDWRRNTADAIAVQLRDAGFTLERRLIAPGLFWSAWRDFPFSVTNWSARPYAVQTLALAYRSGSAWNETGFADETFDGALDGALGVTDPMARRGPMRLLQTRLRDSGIIIQPYWREVFAHAAPTVQGFALHPAFEQHLEGVWLES